MRRLADLQPGELRLALRAGRLVIRSGAFNYRMRSSLPAIAQGLALMYADYPLADPDAFADHALRMEEGTGLHRWWRRQVRFSSDGHYPFEPLPLSHAYPQLEWAMNWCVSTRADHYLMLHAAVIERHGCVAILPAPPGSGKSTLCATLVHRGWRLLSDEVALISLQDGAVTPMVRPISLKNQSIDLMRAFVPDAVFTPVTHGTIKGSVTHMRVPREHVARMDERARPRWVVFPKYVAGAPAKLEPCSRARSVVELGANAFNYTLLGLDGFDALTRLVADCDCFSFSYSLQEDAVATFEALAATVGAEHG